MMGTKLAASEGEVLCLTMELYDRGSASVTHTHSISGWLNSSGWATYSVHEHTRAAANRKKRVFLAQAVGAQA